jgi:hypothetical protein
MFAPYIQLAMSFNSFALAEPLVPTGELGGIFAEAAARELEGLKTSTTTIATAVAGLGASTQAAISASTTTVTTAVSSLPWCTSTLCAHAAGKSAIANTPSTALLYYVTAWRHYQITAGNTAIAASFTAQTALITAQTAKLEARLDAQDLFLKDFRAEVQASFKRVEALINILRRLAITPPGQQPGAQHCF